jgi:hypothetical protein
VSRGSASVACLGVLLAATAPGQALEPAAEATVAASYEDRLIDGGTLPADVSTDSSGAHDESGWPRAFRVQAISSRTDSDGLERDEDGLRFGAMLDTPNYGALTLDANLRRADGFSDESGSLLTAYQLDLPMGGGWFVDNALGAFYTPAVDLVRSQYRFYVPAIMNNGLATEWRQLEALQLHASVGQPGQLVGLYVPTFEDLGGRQVSAGAQWNGSSGFSAALQAVDVTDSRQFLPQDDDSMEPISAQSWLGAFAWGTGESRVQLNLLSSDARDGPGATGAWLDASVRAERVRHHAGAFHMDEDLSWGNRVMPGNLQGGYYRAAFQTRQWLLDGGVDYVAPVTGEASDVVYATGYARYQYSTRTGYGGGGNVRDGDVTAWSTFAFLDQGNPWGIGRVQADYATDETRDNAQLTLDQTWRTPPNVRFSSSVVLGREVFDGDSTSLVGLAVNGGGNVRSDLALDVDVRWDNGSGQSAYDNVLANLSVNWSFWPGWTLGGNYYVNRVSARLPLEVGSPIPGAPGYREQTFDDRGFYVNLRYEWRAGSPLATVGGPSVGGSGSVSGVLYLDDNDNGRQDAGERGAGNVVVLLNGRFPARTDPDGRFEFPAVAAGTHVLTVVPDNLPLPWMFPLADGLRVTVGVRDRVFVPLAAQRLR